MKEGDADENGDHGIEGGKCDDGGGISLFEGREKGEKSDKRKEAAQRRPAESGKIPLYFEFLDNQDDHREGKHACSLKK